MLTIRRMVAGSGFRYLIESIAVGDGAADQSSPLTRYYAESGTPPGRFVGGGLDGAGTRSRPGGDRRAPLPDADGGNRPGHGRPARPPVPSALSRPPWRSGSRRAWPAFPSQNGRQHALASRATERRRRTSSGPQWPRFDLTFSPSKSVSAAWALADEGTKAVIYECHMRAIDYTLPLRGTELPSLPFGQERRRPGGHRGGGRRRVHPLRHPLG